MMPPAPYAKTPMTELFLQRTSRLIAIGVFSLSAGLAAATPAQAQLFGIFRTFQTPSTLSPEMVYRQLVQAGYQPIGRIQRNGQVFVASVYDSRRRQLRLVIDSVQGRILERYVVAARQAEEPATASPALPPRTVPAQPAEPKTRAEPRTPAKPKLTRQEPEKVAPARNPVAAPAITSTPSSAPAVESTATVRPPALQAPVAAAPAAAAPAPAPTRIAPARTEPPPRADGPGYANGVPINPLD